VVEITILLVVSRRRRLNEMGEDGNNGPELRLPMEEAVGDRDKDSKVDGDEVNR